jgi:L-aspartate oxidase
MKRRGDPHVWLDLSHVSSARIRSRFPNIDRRLRALGIDMTREPIPVVPAAHYMCGGVRATLGGRTYLDGLFAIGEVACTGLHGANRLASNSLLEGLVFGARAAIAMPQPPSAARLKADRVNASPEPLVSGPQPAAASLDTAGVRDLMWRFAGLFRTRAGLQEAVGQLDRVYAIERERVRAKSTDGDAWRHLNLVTVAKLIARAALRREESRGGHFREDFPERDDRHWRVHVVDRRDAE